MFSVQTGKVTKAVSKTYKGEIDGLLEQVEIVAREFAGTETESPVQTEIASKPTIEQPQEKDADIIDLEGKKLLRKKAIKRRLLWTSIVVAGGGAAYYYIQTQKEGEIPELPFPPSHP